MVVGEGHQVLHMMVQCIRDAGGRVVHQHGIANRWLQQGAHMVLQAAVQLSQVVYIFEMTKCRRTAKSKIMDPVSIQTQKELLYNILETNCITRPQSYNQSRQRKPDDDLQ